MSVFKFMGDNDFNVTVAVNNGFYSDTTPMVKPGEGVWESICERAHTMTLWSHSLVDFVTGMFLVDSINLYAADYGVQRLVLPYLPGARQDRVNPTGDVLDTALSVADMINARMFQKVVSFDPHSHLMPESIEKFVEYPLEYVIEKHFGGVQYTAVIAPDKGAVERASRAADTLGVPVITADKTRDVADGRITGFSVEGLEKRGTYLVVDDICDGGGTFLGLGEKIKDAGADADLYVSHGIFSKGTRELKEYYDSIVTTDTFKSTYLPGAVRVPIVKEMETYHG